MDSKIKDVLAPDTNGNVSVDQLRDFVLELCEKDLLDRKLTKRDVEGFLSAFNYNAYGATNVQDISTLIYTRDDMIPVKLAERKRANPPPTDVNKDVDVSEVKEGDMHNTKVKKLMNEMGDKVFNGKVKLYNIFKKFDKDHDGFVSYEDFQKCLESIKVIASKQEVASMMKLIDKESKGYLDYSQFSQVFSPNMGDNLVNIPLNDTYFPNLQPSGAVNKRNIDRQTKMQDAVKEIRKSFQPDFDSQLVAPTRFSSKPQFKNTFENFQQESGAPGFISEKQRLGRTQKGQFSAQGG
mmetsp:Transcript_8413/g.12807  ORF Transcript_8413/g.12807 Transcript_8413/m.12807 type:complete len:295 (+) Transcript_8413:1398-2282(+)